MRKAIDVGGRAQRWPEGVPVPGSHPCACAEQRSGRGGARASRALLTSSWHLFEVSERSDRCELCHAPLTRAAQVARSAAGVEGRRHRGRLLLLPFLGETRKGSRLRGRDPASERRGAAGVRAEAGARGGNSYHCVGSQFRGRGMRPAAQSLSFDSPKESNQRKGDPGPRVPTLRFGQPVLLAAQAHCTTRTTHCVRSPRTGAMSQSTMRTMLVRRPCHCAARRGDRGGIGNGNGNGIGIGIGRRNLFGPSLRSALASGVLA
jgi:hypothetical protein